MNEEIGGYNRKTYAQKTVVESLAKLGELFPAEKVLLKRLAPKIRNRSLLDIGIGGGRTIKHLLALSENYVGVDYVPEFVMRARKSFPATRFIVSDARFLNEFEDEDFDFALFSFNGIDYISHADRLRALTQIRRVLKPHGTLMFSTHNRDYKYFNQPPWRTPFDVKAEYFKNLARHFLYRRNRLEMKKREILNDEYAIINDCAYRYSLMTYYIGVEAQRRQLEKIGFRQIEAVNLRGETVENDNESLWTNYLAEK